MSTHIGKHFDPWQQARRNVRWAGTIDTSGLTRLTQAVHAIADVADVNLEFGEFALGPGIRGAASVRVERICQRCLMRFAMWLRADIDVLLVSNDEQAQRVRGVDPLQITDGKLNLETFVEDELLLAMPEFVYHDDAQCAGAVSTDGDNDSAGTRESPFGILLDLKTVKHADKA